MRKRPTLWADFLRSARPHVDWDHQQAILCLDPGETTGWAKFAGGELVACGQLATPTPAVLAEAIRDLAANELPHSWQSDIRLVEYSMLEASLALIVFEEYRIRGNKSRQHIGSEVVTIQHIGAIHVVAAELDIPTVKQSAGMAKTFATDPKLRRWGLYQTGLRHANDAIRHGCHYLIFYHEPEKRSHAQPGT